MRQKKFCFAGPVREDYNYILPPLARLDMDSIQTLLDDGKYFVLHAPRQTGKTTALNALRHHLNESGKFRCIYTNVEPAQVCRNDAARGARAITEGIILDARDTGADLTLLPRLGEFLSHNPDKMLGNLLSEWLAADPDRPAVLLIDEVDSLVGDTLISLLRQLRAGYNSRPARFPSSIILCGVRDVRDYRIHNSSGEVITGGSAFNIKSESLRLGNFTREEINALYAQHTAATGQIFTDEALSLAWDMTEGQPWLVNALANMACFQRPVMREEPRSLPTVNDRSLPVTPEVFQQAAERLILRRDTHLDQLIDKLKEPRVHSVIGPILESEEDDIDAPPADIEYCRDLGLIAPGKPLRIANRIYRETLPRELTWGKQFTMRQEHTWFQNPDSSLDLQKLMSAFQQFYREGADAWIKFTDYPEAGPQLLLQAFLQRIINGGGTILREYGLGRRRTDLSIAWPYGEDKMQRAVIEMKIHRAKQSRETIETQGLEQTRAYADTFGAAEAHLVIVDRRDPAPTWDERITRREDVAEGKLPVTVWGM